MIRPEVRFPLLVNKFQKKCNWHEVQRQVEEWLP